MNPKRLLATIAGAAMLATVPVALTATSAEAATTVDSRIVVNKTSSVYKYGSTITLSGAVQGNHPTNGWGSADTSGNIRLYRKLAPYSTYKLISTDTTENSFSFRVKASGNAMYKLVYSGGSYGSYVFRAKNAYRSISVARDANESIVKSSTGRLYFKGNVDPGYAYKNVRIVRSRYSKGTYATYKYAKTNKYGAFQASVVAPSSGRYYYRVIIPATKPTFVQTTSSTWYTYKY